MGTPTELQRKTIEFVAYTLFGRERSERAPNDTYWCLSAVDCGHADKFSGPWFRYADDPLWQCELCYEDRCLSEYGSIYLLGGAGMVAAIEKLGDQLCWEFLKSEGKWYAWCSNNGTKTSGHGATMPEAVMDCLTAAIPAFKVASSV